MNTGAPSQQIVGDGLKSDLARYLPARGETGCQPKRRLGEFDLHSLPADRHFGIQAGGHLHQSVAPPPIEVRSFRRSSRKGSCRRLRPRRKNKSRSQTDQDKPETPSVVVVTPEAPNIELFQCRRWGICWWPRRWPPRRRLNPQNGARHAAQEPARQPQQYRQRRRSANAGLSPNCQGRGDARHSDPRFNHGCGGERYVRYREDVLRLFAVGPQRAGICQTALGRPADGRPVFWKCPLRPYAQTIQYQ